MNRRQKSRSPPRRSKRLRELSGSTSSSTSTVARVQAALSPLVTAPAAAWSSFVTLLSAIGRSNPSPSKKAPKEFVSKQPGSQPWHLHDVCGSWASTKSGTATSRFPNSEKKYAVIGRGGLCARHDYDALNEPCTCIKVVESVHWQKFPAGIFEPSIANENLELYKTIAEQEIMPLMREVLITQLKKECGAQFKRKYKGWNDTPDDFPDAYKTRYWGYQYELWEYCYEQRRLPICLFDLTGNYDATIFPTGRIKDATAFSTAAREYLDEHNEKKKKQAQHCDKIRKEEEDREKFANLGCPADCPCSTGFAERCSCTNYPINASGQRAYMDNQGLYRMGNGVAPLGVDGIPTPLTSAEIANIALIGCNENCSCGDGCKQKRLSKGCRYLEIINVAPIIGLEIRAGEHTPRGEVGSLMSGKWVLRSESSGYDKRMFLKEMSRHWNFLFTADDYKNEFFIYGHQCEPTMTVVKCYIDRLLNFARPLAISRCALGPGEVKGWHYANGRGIPEFICICGSPNCCNPP